MDWPEHWLEQAEPLWKKIAFHEVKEYLIHVLQEHGIRYEPGEKTSQVINSLLENFSVAQINSMIWSKANATTGWLSRTRAPKQRATNYLLAAIQGYGDKIIAKDWDINEFNRNYECEISAVAEIFYNKIIQTDGFRKVPKL
jgi:hypothetical protein